MSGFDEHEVKLSPEIRTMIALADAVERVSKFKCAAKLPAAEFTILLAMVLARVVMRVVKHDKTRAILFINELAKSMKGDILT